MSLDSTLSIKCLLVGDEAAGKSALAYSYMNDTFTLEYIPTVMDNYIVDVKAENNNLKLML